MIKIETGVGIGKTKRRKKLKKRRKINFKMITAFLIFQIIFSLIMAPFIIFWGPFQALKVIAVGAVYTSRHPQVLRIFYSQQDIDNLIHQNDVLAVSGQTLTKSNPINPSAGIVIEDIQGKNVLGTFRGKVMLIEDPKRVKVAVTKQLGVNGERVSDLVKDMGAIAGINGGGFYDPDGKGNGAYPDGLTVHDGKLIHNNVGNQAVNMIALDKEGNLTIGDLTAAQLQSKNIQEAVHFEPNLIVNEKKGDFTDAPYGYAPRTAIGQKADGTIIFLVIDGRQPLWSMGASMSDLYNIFQDYGAVNAVNLDGGSSSELVYDGKVQNKLWDIFGERYIPTAFVVTPQ